MKSIVSDLEDKLGKCMEEDLESRKEHDMNDETVKGEETKSKEKGGGPPFELMFQSIEDENKETMTRIKKVIEGVDPESMKDGYVIGRIPVNYGRPTTLMRRGPIRRFVELEGLKLSASGSEILVISQSNYDPQYFEYPQPQTMLVDMCLEDGRPAYLVGPTGCGKSELVINLAGKRERPIRRVALNGSMTEDDLIGTWSLEGGNTKFCDGPIPACMKAGEILVLEEVDMCPPQVLSTAQLVLEMNGNGRVKSFHNHKNGETVEPKKGFQIIAIANTRGRVSGDMLYHGTYELNESFLDRFVMVEFEYVDSAKLLKIKTGVGSDVCEKVFKFAKAARAGFEKNDIQSLISTRELVAMMMLYRNLKERIEDPGEALALAAHCTVFSKDSESKKTLMQLFQRATDVDPEAQIAAASTKLKARGGY